MLQYYKIAGLIVAMDSFGRTVEQAKPYLVSQQESVDITITSYRDTMKERYPGMDDDNAEYMHDRQIALTTSRCG